MRVEISNQRLGAIADRSSNYKNQSEVLRGKIVRVDYFSGIYLRKLLIYINRMIFYRGRLRVKLVCPDDGGIFRTLPSSRQGLSLA